MSSLKLAYIEIVYVFMWMLHEFFVTGIYWQRLFMWMLHEFFGTGTYWRDCLCICYIHSLKLAYIEIVHVNVTWVLWKWYMLKLFMWMLQEFFETGTYWRDCLCECYMNSLKLAHIEIVYVNVTRVLWNWYMLKLFM
jgi:hypothetical protein